MCETDYGPFDDVKGGPMADAQGRLRMDIMNEEDKILLNAIQELSSFPFTNFYSPFSRYDLDARMF